MKSKELIELQKEWYAKLAKEGFEDIEEFDAQMEPIDTLKRSTFTHALKIKDRYVQQEAYYNAAGKLAHSTLIPEKDREIWRLHAQGYTHRQIVEMQNRSHRGVYLLLNRTKILLEEYCKGLSDEEVYDLLDE